MSNSHLPAPGEATGVSHDTGQDGGTRIAAARNTAGRGGADPAGPGGGDGPTATELLELEEIDRDLYRARSAFPDRLNYNLYGGQVAAQALRAAGLTVAPDREPHSLHGYFLRPGDPSRLTVFQVFRDRDGRSFSARRVVALQHGEVIFNMSASFHATRDGYDEQVHDAPAVPGPEECRPFDIPRLYSVESRVAPRPAETGWPMRLWARCTVALPDDPLLHACVLTYLSDVVAGLAPLRGAEYHSGPSLDHSVWSHRPARMDDWVLLDLAPNSAARGRGWYTGALYTTGGRLAASIAQEVLFSPIRRQASRRRPIVPAPHDGPAGPAALPEGDRPGRGTGWRAG